MIDSSVALTWCFEDERTPATKSVLEQVVDHGGLLPRPFGRKAQHRLTLYDASYLDSPGACACL